MARESATRADRLFDGKPTRTAGAPKAPRSGSGAAAPSVAFGSSAGSPIARRGYVASETVTLAKSVFELDDSYARAVPALSVPWAAAPVPAPGCWCSTRSWPPSWAGWHGVAGAGGGVACWSGTAWRTARAGRPGLRRPPVRHLLAAPRRRPGPPARRGRRRHGRRRDVHLKGSGRTPFARGGDGRAALGPMLREYVISEAMHALGIPTTRSLAVVTTGEPVYRETALPGAVLEPRGRQPPPGRHVRVRGRVRRPDACARSPTTRSPATTRRPPTPANPYLELYRASSTDRRPRSSPGGCSSASSTG